jgi:signal transduction histidine kinase/ActR/RegA family two-component response regulator
MNPKHPVNILLVDDQPGKLLSYETILAELDENLIRAGSGREALEILLKTDVAVVLVDVCMPDLDGFELASMIRSHPRFQKTAILLVSGILVEDVDRMKGYDSGAVDYISVPIVPGILRAKVAVFADLYRKTEQLQQLNQELERRVAERTAAIEAGAALLRLSEERLRLVLTANTIQGWTWGIATNEFSWVGPPADAQQEAQSLGRFLNSVHPADRPSVQSAFDRATQGSAEYVAEFRTRQAGEGDQWWLGRGTVILDDAGRPRSIAGINTNITERKRAEEERIHLLKHAEEARREAERANQLKDEFLATLSHELRTPLNAITGWAHMLRDGLDPATQEKAVEAINRNALFQSQLISDLLDVSRIVSGKLNLESKPVDLSAVIQSAIDTIGPAAQAKNIFVDVEVGTASTQRVEGDAGRLQQVIWNLLSNAVKFTPASGHVQVRAEKVNGGVELTVQDDGPGIQPAFLPHIFERFRQADSSSTRSHRGLGLGLAIVRHLVEMHGGRVEAANRQDRSGAVFKAFLPASTSEPRAIAERKAANLIAPENGSVQPQPTSLLKGVRVLVVDDEADAREVVALILRRHGAEVITASSAPEALGLLERELPQVLVADIEMPVEDGYSLIRKLREIPSPRGANTPVIALTAYAGEQDRARVLRAGFNLHVPKPVQPPELIAAIASLAKAGWASAPPRISCAVVEPVVVEPVVVEPVVVESAVVEAETAVTLEEPPEPAKQGRAVKRQRKSTAAIERTLQ